LLLLVLSGILAYFISTIDPAFDALFLALIFGIFFGLFYTDERKKAIMEKSLGITLPIGITLYGANINFPYLGYFPPKVVVITLLVAGSMGTAIFLLASRFKISKSLALLLACGTSICGVSAIAILSPIVRPKKKHEFSAAIIIITVVGLTGAVLYPTFGYLFSLSPGVWAFVLAAVWVYYFERRPGEKVQKMEIWWRFPKFVLGYFLAMFLILCIGMNLYPDPGTAYKALTFGIKPVEGSLRKFFFLLTNVSIGIVTDFRTLRQEGLGKLALAYAFVLAVIIIPIG